MGRAADPMDGEDSISMMENAARGPMKGLVLSGGKGTRMRPFTYTAAKQLVPIANKPVLFYVLEDLVAAGITEIGIIVGDTADQIQAAVGDGQRFGANVTYIPQSAPLGLAHAVATAQPFLGDSRFVVYLGDNFIRGGAAGYINAFAGGREDAHVLLHRVEQPENLGVAVVENGRLCRLVEKPREFVSDLGIVGIYMFDIRVFEACRSIRPSARGELEMTDALQWLIDQGAVVGHSIVTVPWIDTGKASDMLEANRLILELLGRAVEGNIDSASLIQGQVVVEQGAQIVNSTLRGPLIVGHDSVIRDSYIGPFTTIDHHCIVEGCELEYSIVQEHSTLRNIHHRIEQSMIGRFVEVDHAPERPKAHRLILGDHSSVRLT
jgi:glucose-1-phosphate thymidylyltransferase